MSSKRGAAVEAFPAGDPLLACGCSQSEPSPRKGTPCPGTWRGPKGGDSTAPAQPSVRLLGSCPPRAGLRKVRSWGACAMNFQVRPV